ncbi:acyltransferase family protein [Pseudaquidulcibacter saccharophilus]|uniref:acyltransferase family protein n=1 Tax=Pseudaquidulcibacter saccharophilus TaxID=2831900 RepID=UPI001EFF3515|nr:acyltransferase [Pseudaquidulcibacter saccharophilus]
MNKSTEETSHFAILDGMRGIAAIFVFMYHCLIRFNAWCYGNQTDVIGMSMMAVDFFFMLSGFVLAYSYERKLQNGFEFKKFITLRIIRLSPMVVLSAFIGFMVIQSMALWVTGALDSNSLNDLILTIFMVPKALFGGQDMFPLNGALWSLFFEYIAYIGFALLIIKLSDKQLFILCLFGFLGFMYWAFQSLGINSPKTDEPTMMGGLLRVLFCFPMGVYIFRIRNKITQANIVVTIALILSLILFFCLPRRLLPFWVYPLLFTLISPTLIIFASKHKISGNWLKSSNFLADISFPLYVIHSPIIAFIGFFANNIFHLEGNIAVITLCLATIPSMIIISYLLAKYYDAPVRVKLKQAMERRWISKIVKTKTA